jgi:hypothetical protein
LDLNEMDWMARGIFLGLDWMVGDFGWILY